MLSSTRRSFDRLMVFCYYSKYDHVVPIVAEIHFDYTWDYEFQYRLNQLYQRKHYCYWYLSNLRCRSMDYYCYYSFPKCFQWLEIYLNNVYYYYCYCSRQFSSYQENFICNELLKFSLYVKLFHHTKLFHFFFLFIINFHL
jgi:hypothetical protein